MVTKRRHKEEEKGRGRRRATAIRSHYSTINSKHNANFGRNLQNDKPESLVMEVFRSHRQDSPDWKTTFFLGTFFFRDSLWGKWEVHQLGLQGTKWCHDCYLQPQTWQSFFQFLKLQSAQFVTFTVQVTCLSLKTLPHNTPQKRHVSSSCWSPGALALCTKGSLGSRKYRQSTSGSSPPARADTEQMETWLIWWSLTPPSSWLIAAVPQHSHGILAGSRGDLGESMPPSAMCKREYAPKAMCKHFTGEWEAEAPKIEKACAKAVYKVRYVKKPKAQADLSRAGPPLMSFLRNVKPGKIKTRRKSIFCLHLLWKSQISDLTTTLISSTLPSPRESCVIFVFTYSGEKVVMYVYTQVCSCADGGTSNKNGYSYTPSCFPTVAATWQKCPCV